MKVIRTFPVCIIVLLFSLIGPAKADDFKLIIGCKNYQLQGHFADIPLYFMGNIKSVDNLNLLIGYHSKALEFNNIISGDIEVDSKPDSPEYRRIDFNTLIDFEDTTGLAMYKHFKCEQFEGSDSARIRISAQVGNLNAIDYDESNESDSLLLFTFKFYVTNDRTYGCDLLPVQFVWDSCDDNTIFLKKQKDGISQTKIARVKDVFLPFNMSVPSERYISYDDYLHKKQFYVPRQYLVYDMKNVESCIAEYSYSQPGIYFFNGVMDLGCIELEVHGDMNLNGISNEIADLYKYRDFFLIGDSAFTINKDGQYAASDVNADGRILTLQD